MKSQFEHTDMVEGIEGSTARTQLLNEIVSKLEEKGAPKQVIAILNNESDPYDEIITLELLKPALLYQSGRFARAAGDIFNQTEEVTLQKDLLIERARQCIEASDVVDRAIYKKGPTTMYDSERKSLIDMAAKLEKTVTSMVIQAQPDTDPNYIDFYHMKTAINSILNNAEVINTTDLLPNNESNPKFIDTSGPHVEGKEVPKVLQMELKRLRSEVHASMWKATEERIASNPRPTDEEIVLGAFLEEIEPQVVEALRIFNKKGYSTASSGFYGEGYQTIDGFLELTDQEAKALEEAGAVVKRRPNGYSYVSFLPDSANIEDLTHKWYQLAEALPDRGIPARPAYTAGTVSFWEEHCNPADVERVKIEIRLANRDYIGDDVKTELEKRLLELKKEK